jgi:hypothetical protein
VLGKTATLSDRLMYALGGLLALGIDAYLLQGKWLGPFGGWLQDRN